MDEARYAAAVGAIYDAALDERHWSHALGLISDVFGAGPAALLFQDQVTWLGSGATARLDPTALSAFYQYYAKLNPLTTRNHLADLDLGLPITLDQQVISKSELIQTEFYNDFYEPNDMHSALMIAAGARGRRIATINIMRSSRALEFDGDDVRLAADLQVHLVRAFQLAVRMADSARADGTLAEIMDYSPHGMFLVGVSGLVQRANRAGMAMVGDGLMIAKGELVGASPEATRHLRKAIAEASEQGSTRRQNAAVVLRRPYPRRALSVVVTPLGRDAAAIFDVGPTALVCVSDPEAAVVPNATVLAQLFDLSPGEIRVVERLALGENPQQVAAALDIGISTTRWHLASIFRKTGTAGQVELIRLMLSLPSRRAIDREMPP